MKTHFCRSCHHSLGQPVLDLGYTAPSNSLRSQIQMESPEVSYPLRIFVCQNCWLLQTQDVVKREDLFSADYHYFSSISSSWLRHCETFVKEISSEMSLNSKSLVFEIASNDGYLLQFFKSLGVPCIGVEPTESTANESRKRGIETISDFFSSALANSLTQTYGNADLIICNNVYAHVPDINDFTLGISILLGTEGVCTIEFPHLLNLIKFREIDTIYHEHFSYLSLIAVESIMERNGLKIFKVEEISTHGGSLRIYVSNKKNHRIVDESVQKIREEEISFGLTSIKTFTELGEIASSIKYELLTFLLSEKNANRKVAAIGAAAKGNTLLNYARVGSDLITYVVDRSPAKQGKFLPFSHIPVVSPERLLEDPPDSVLILPWNLAEELIQDYQSLIPSDSEIYVSIPALKKIKRGSANLAN